MTNNQIAYANYKEVVRHNRETERLGYGQLSEMKRHNIRTEDLGFGQLAESSRHNMVTEDINWYNAEENQRHNISTEGISKQELGLRTVQLGVDTMNVMSQVGLRYAQTIESGERRKNLATERKRMEADTALIKSKTKLSTAQEMLLRAKTRQSTVDTIRGAVGVVEGITALVGIGD